MLLTTDACTPQLIQKETTLAIEAEQKQLERMQFALEKARNDAAFYKVCVGFRWHACFSMTPMAPARCG
jgi:hypothetical protein